MKEKEKRESYNNEVKEEMKNPRSKYFFFSCCSKRQKEVGTKGQHFLSPSLMHQCSPVWPRP